MKGFKAFLLRGNIVDLAVAVVVGVAFTAVVKALVGDLITPLISAIFGQPRFQDLSFAIGKSTFAYGDFLNALISFLLISAVVYFLIVAPMTKVIAFTHRKKESMERECPECLQQIPAKATRCMYCTASVSPVPERAGGHRRVSHDR